MNNDNYRVKKRSKHSDPFYQVLSLQVLYRPFKKVKNGGEDIAFQLCCQAHFYFFTA